MFVPQELDAQLLNMKTGKAPGPDDICAEHLRHLGPRAKTALLRLINLTWTTGQIPSPWRRAVIILIPKAGKDPKLTTSHRPIALTSHLAKLAERLVAARLTFLAERDGLVPPEQVGFRRGRSAEENLGRLVQQVQGGWNKPKPRGRPADGRTAEKFALLAPTLYTLWSADLITDLKTVPGTEIYMYADDTATLSSGASIEQAERRAQQAADVISGWAARWKMRIAGEKTQALALSQLARDATHLKVKVTGAEVTAGTSLRLLGVTFDRLLHFGPTALSCARRCALVSPTSVV